MDLLQPNTQAGSFSFAYEKQPKKNNNQIPIVRTRAFVSQAKRLANTVQGYDRGFVERIRVQHQGGNVIEALGESARESLDQLFGTYHPLMEYALIHQKEPEQWLALQRDMLVPYKLLFIGQRINPRLEERIRGRFEKEKNGYILQPYF